jgi:hypothetical protein
MNNLMSNFSGLALSRIEMKNVTGGCGYRCGSGSTYTGMSKSSAQSFASSCASWGQSGHWCCASC